MSLPMLPYRSLVKLASRIWIASQQQNHSQSSLVNPFKMNNRVYTRRPKKMVIAEIQSACVAVFHFCTDRSTEPSSGTLAARLSTSAKPILGEGRGERKQRRCQRITHWTLTRPVRTPRCEIYRAWEVALLLVLSPTGVGTLD